MDVRRHPFSRRNPQFTSEALAAALADSGVGYVREPDLGGRREPTPDSPNGGWRNAGFRGYADPMASPPFHAAFGRLRLAAGAEPTAILCAEAVPWSRHRQLIADALVAQGIRVIPILGTGRSAPHELSPHPCPAAA